MAAVSNNPFQHFYRQTNEGILELFIAPIQPTTDGYRSSSPRGWLIAGRVWDDHFTEQLSPDARFRIEILETPATPPEAAPGRVRARHLLKDEHDQVIGSWLVSHADSEPTVFLDSGHIEAVLLIALGLVGTILFLSLMHQWIIGPIDQIDNALHLRKSDPLNPLAKRPHEFGQLARLLQEYFRQNEQLSEETELRRETETALRQKEQRLREAMQERTQLGSDLHDSTIQTLYAAGLNLSAIELAIKGDHPDSARQLKELRRSLQISVDDLRWFIHNLETEVSPHSFNESIDSMINLLRNTDTCEIDSEIDDDVAEALTVEQRINLLQVLREAVSNAIRHARPQNISVRLQRTASMVKMSVTDDGIGMPESVQNSSSLGLNNMRYRAQQANALLTIKSPPEGGTSVRLNFTLET